MAQAHSLPVTPVSSVREGERDLMIEHAEPSELTQRTAEAVAAVHEERMLGRLAVIVAAERVGAIAAALRAHGGLPAVGVGSAGVDDEIAVMTAQDAKGLELKRS